MTDILAELEPENAAYLEKLKKGRSVPLDKAHIDDLRSAAREMRASWHRPEPAMHSSRDGFWEGLRYRMHRPTDSAVLPAIVYLHGGGWVQMDVDTHDSIIRRLAAASGAAVLAVDYPLAPEAPFPAGLDGCAGFADFVGDAAEELGLGRGKIALAGDSAGANLAMALALQLRDRGEWQPSALGLFYGCYESRLDRPSMGLYGGGDVLTFSTARLRFFLDCYVPTPEQRNSPFFSVLDSDVHGLPPAFLAVASHDILRDENLAMAAKLRGSGNEVECRVYPGTIHGFAEAATATGSPLAMQAIADTGRFLARYLEA